MQRSVVAAKRAQIVDSNTPISTLSQFTMDGCSHWTEVAMRRPGQPLRFLWPCRSHKLSPYPFSHRLRRAARRLTAPLVLCPRNGVSKREETEFSSLSTSGKRLWRRRSRQQSIVFVFNHCIAFAGALLNAFAHKHANASARIRNEPRFLKL